MAHLTRLPGVQTSDSLGCVGVILLTKSREAIGMVFEIIVFCFKLLLKDSELNFSNLNSFKFFVLSCY